jgi:signal transduction histidine kinase
MDIGYTSMDKILKIKIALIFIYLAVAILFFYDEHFLTTTKPIYTYNTLEFMIAILSLGVILSSTVYNLAFYFYIRNRQYLYYALAQIAIISLLVEIENLFISPFSEFYDLPKNLFWLDISQIFIVIFSMLFLREFLVLYKIKNLNRLINTVLYLAIFDLLFTIIFSHAILTKFIPSFIWILLVLSEAQRVSPNKDIPFYYILIGWYSVLFISLIEYFEFAGLSVKTFPFLHLSFAIESMLLSFAISYKFRLIEREQKIQQSLLLHQSRLASMGEMISIIAHQWRQPLNYLAFAFMHIKKSCNGDKEALLTIKDANEQLQYMSKTIENFRNFYNPSKNRENFSIEESCKSIIQIVTPIIQSSKINIKIDTKNDFHFFANSNEFEQVILNIINNAKDALIERKIKEPRIEIVIDKPTIKIIDNAGGIDKKVKDKIFEPYFTTKKSGDGIGLYIAKTIIEYEMGGELSFTTNSNGTTFIITLDNFN